MKISHWIKGIYYNDTNGWYVSTKLLPSSYISTFCVAIVWQIGQKDGDFFVLVNAWDTLYTFSWSRFFWTYYLNIKSKLMTTTYLLFSALLVRTMINKRTTVELRNESFVTGKVRESHSKVIYFEWLLQLNDRFWRI